MVARPLPVQLLLSRMAWWVVRIRDRWIFNGPPSSLVTSWRATQRWMATRPIAPVVAMVTPGAQPQPQLAALPPADVTAQ